jgi:hypothetical protein
MELVPSSANMALRQHEKLRAVYSLRLQGGLVALVDKIVERANSEGGVLRSLSDNRQRRYDLTRSEYIERAIKEAVERDMGSHGDKPAKPAKKGRKS